ncbi:hypothetical protein HOY80DRAFT_652032 [Tuber brumale]|nr:hypothetical protein HOY80DRAFT_652032 [Tuber brumale]
MMVVVVVVCLSFALFVFVIAILLGGGIIATLATLEEKRMRVWGFCRIGCCRPMMLMKMQAVSCFPDAAPQIILYSSKRISTRRIVRWMMTQPVWMPPLPVWAWRSRGHTAEWSQVGLGVGTKGAPKVLATYHCSRVPDCSICYDNSIGILYLYVLVVQVLNSLKEIPVLVHCCGYSKAIYLCWSTVW